MILGTLLSETWLFTLGDQAFLCFVSPAYVLALHKCAYQGLTLCKSAALFTLQELYDVEQFAIKTVARTFWRLPVIFIVMFIVRGMTHVTHFACCILCDPFELPVCGRWCQSVLDLRCYTDASPVLDVEH